METIKQLLLGLKDPRIERQKLHSLEDIILLTLIAVICGCESWETIEEFGKSKKAYLKNYLSLENGIPSHDTIERLFKRLNSKSFSEVLLALSALLRDKRGQDFISIDGKTLRGSKNLGNGKYAIHLVSAWCNHNRLVLGHVKTASKSNEIEAVKELLNMLEIEGAVITADAMSCQKEIASQIVAQKADYILAIKDNHKTFKSDIEHEFKTQTNIQHHQSVGKDHGRIETRTCEVIHSLKELEGRQDWTGLKTIVKITSQRQSGQVIQTEERYYLSSKEENAEYFNQAVRSHWGIENTLHWTLDVQFGEDKSRKRKDNAAENMAIVRRIALNKLLVNPYKRQGIENRRRIASWNEEYLNAILKI